MKRLIWAAALTFLLAAIIVFGKYTVTSNCRALLDEVEACQSEKNTASAIAKAEALENKWNKKEWLLSIFINRNIVQEIGVHIALIKQTASEPDSLDYGICCREAYVLLSHAVKNQRLSF